MTYSLEFDMRREKSTRCGRPYASKLTVKAAAMKAFRRYAKDGSPRDELRVYEGNLSSWAGPEPRYIGKVAYEGDGATISWFPAT